MTIYKVSLCAIIKDEIDLEEWVSYNLLIGFEHLYLYDDGSAVPISNRLEGIKDQITVVDYKYTGDLKLKQVGAYEDFRKNYGHETEFVAFFDGDEFLVLKQHKNVRELLDYFGNIDGLGINWIMFNWNNHVARPNGLVIENYTTYYHHPFIKSIVRVSSIIKCDVHYIPLQKNSKYINSKGNLITNHIEKDPTTIDIVQLNHYFSRSMTDWGYRLSRKQCRGVSRQMGEFYSFIGERYIDTTIIDKNYPEKIKKFMKTYKLSNDEIVKQRISLPHNFNPWSYLYLNSDIAEHNCSEEYSIIHYLMRGYKENREYNMDRKISQEEVLKKYKILPEDFYWYNYLFINRDVARAKCHSEFAVYHYINHGIVEKRIYRDKNKNLDSFDWKKYSDAHPELKFTKKEEVFQYVIINGLD